VRVLSSPCQILSLDPDILSSILLSVLKAREHVSGPNHPIAIITIIIILLIIKLLVINMPSKQLQGQLQPQHNVDTGNYIKGKRNI
jgi:hypothetical protein